MKLSRLSFALIERKLASFLRSKHLNPSKQGNEQEENIHSRNDPIQKTEASGTVVYSVAIQPSAEDRERYEDETADRKRQIRVSVYLNWITVIGAGVGGLGLLILWSTLLATNEGLKQSREQFLVSQRAHVTVSNKDGKVASFQNRKNPVLELYFYNSGPSPALNFIVFARHSFYRGDFAYSPQNRYTSKSKGGAVMEGHLGAVSIAAEGSYIHDFHNISQEQLDQIRSGKNLFVVDGIFHYCDIFGRFRSEHFSVRYRPTPIDDFVPGPFPRRSRVSQMSDPPQKGLRETIGDLVILPRCQQPHEDETN